jgi:predicted ABC-type transport system involved in lysophospholipase L1 biosynthesis ATPase subunit
MLSEAAPVAIAPVVLDDVTKRYGRGRGAVTALDGVSLVFPASSFTAVLGVSGSGKSTLLQCAAGLERSSSGTVRLCGKELSRLSHRQQAVLRRQRVGFVFQELNLLPVRRSGRTSSGRPSAWVCPARSSGGGRPSCPAASSSEWRSPAR